eukprot:1394406-Amorphochlora_amoeboformis.AAC.1
MMIVYKLSEGYGVCGEVLRVWYLRRQEFVLVAVYYVELHWDGNAKLSKVEQMQLRPRSNKCSSIQGSTDTATAKLQSRSNKFSYIQGRTDTATAKVEQIQLQPRSNRAATPTVEQIQQQVQPRRNGNRYSQGRLLRTYSAVRGTV